MPTCAGCGLKIGENWNYCPRCGAEVLNMQITEQIKAKLQNQELPLPDEDHAYVWDKYLENYRKSHSEPLAPGEKELVDYVAAVETYHKAEPDYYYSYNSVGLDYMKKEQYERAIGFFEAAIKIRPNFAEAYYNKAAAYAKLGHDDKAINNYQKAISINPKFAEAYYTLGVSYSKRGDHESAAAQYQKALTLNPDFADAFYNLGITYMFWKKDLRTALGLIGKAAELGNENALKFLAQQHHKETEKSADEHNQQ